MGKLVVMMRDQDKVYIGDDIEITFSIKKFNGSNVNRLIIDAPSDLRVLRGKLKDKQKDIKKD